MWLDGHLISRFATCFVAVSAANRERMITLEGVSAGEDPGDSDRLRSSSRSVGREHPQRTRASAPDAQVIGVAAVMRKEKALDVMLDAHAMLVERDSPMYTS